ATRGQTLPIRPRWPGGQSQLPTREALVRILLHKAGTGHYHVGVDLSWRLAMNSFLGSELRLDPAYEVENKLQGTWVVMSGRWKCQLSFAAHHFALHFQSGEVYLGVYIVDPTRRPGGMDMTIEEGPEHYRGLTSLCLYELEGDTLRWCGN